MEYSAELFPQLDAIMTYQSSYVSLLEYDLSSSCTVNQHNKNNVPNLSTISENAYSQENMLLQPEQQHRHHQQDQLQLYLSTTPLLSSVMTGCKDTNFQSIGQQQHHHQAFYPVYINTHYPISTTSSQSDSSCYSILAAQQQTSLNDSLYHDSNSTSSPLLSETDHFNLSSQEHLYHHSTVSAENYHLHGSSSDTAATTSLLTPLYEMLQRDLVQPSSSQVTFHPAHTLVGSEDCQEIHADEYPSPSFNSPQQPSSPSISSYSSLSSFTDDSQPMMLKQSVGVKVNSMYRCEYQGCTKTFTRTYNLKSHRRTHTDEKPFVCHVCSKAFARQHDRNRHAKLHLGLKPYPCQFCPKSFARQDALNRHLKRDNSKKKNMVDENGFVDDSFIRPPPCLLIKLRKKRMAMMKKKKEQLQ